MIGYLIAAGVFLAVTFPLAFVWHLTVMKARYDALGVYRDRPAPPLGLLAMLIQAPLFAVVEVALILPWAPSWWCGALGYFAFGFLLSWSFGTISPLAKQPMTSLRAFFALETIFTALQWVIIALVTSLLLTLVP